MGRCIVKIKDKYLEWSSIVDAPVTFGMTLDELKGYIKEEYGREGMRELDKRLERVERTGASTIYEKSVDSIISCNRAGPNESHLTLEEIYQAYCLMQPIRDGWKAPVGVEDDPA